MRKLIVSLVVLATSICSAASDESFEQESLAEAPKRVAGTGNSSTIAIMTYSHAELQQAALTGYAHNKSFSRSRKLKEKTPCAKTASADKVYATSKTSKNSLIKRHADSLADDVYNLLDSAIEKSQRSLKKVARTGFTDNKKGYQLISTTLYSSCDSGSYERVIQL